jgi:glycosyltransferase involved in cell wall biosynthesis
MDLYQHQIFLAQKMLYADNVFLVCEFNRAYIKNRYPAEYPALQDRIHIHHLGLDLANTEFRPAGRPPATVVGVGRFEPLKGFHCLLEAAGRLTALGRPITVELVGGGESEAQLRGVAERLGVNVRFRGWLQQDEVLEVMRQATILVHPPVTLDAMPTVLKEAIAVGTPVIASDLAGIPEILDRGRCGILVPPGNVDRLTEAIDQLLSNPEARNRLAHEGRRHAERMFDLWTNGRALAHRLQSTSRHDRANR